MKIINESERVIARTRYIGQAFDAQMVLRSVKPLLTLKWTTLGRDPAPRIIAWAQEHLPEADPFDDPDSIVMYFNRDDLAEALQISQDTKLACSCRYLVSVDDTMEARKARKRPKDRIGAQQRRSRNGGKRREDCTTRDDERTLAVVLGLGCGGDRTIRNWKKKGVPVSALRRWHSDGTYEANVDMVRQIGLVVPEFSQKRRSRPIIKGLVATSLGKKLTSVDCTAGVAGQDGSRAGIVDADTSTVQTRTRESGRDLEAVAHLADPFAAPQTWPMWVRMEALALAA
ncbi:hypothetical protein [Methylobacterium sp. 174MFSha1.1]|uniref:hypothetical protein n=1 Tax=Methylobacterium sp. 174MFSha1.1 TaxID=1502749 RepID=UPI000B815116|nr:hypothetical protein [Methylobacterium sp. 174MFSha1.1]